MTTANDEELKKKLIFTNSKNVRNSQWYADVITELKARNPEFNFSIKQTREKFKRCVTKCRTAAMIIKTKSGIKRFQEDKGYGTWFSCLYPVISTMDHCQPEQAIEPGHMPVPADGIDTIVEAVEEPAVGSSTKTTFVPIHETSKRKKRKADKIGETMDKMVTLIEEESSRSKEIIKLMKTESERQEKMDMEFLSMMRSIVDSNNMQQQQRSQNMRFVIETCSIF